MSKDQKSNDTILVEMVEKIDFMLNWITTTITSYNLNDKWPTNYIQDTVDELINVLELCWENPFNDK